MGLKLYIADYKVIIEQERARCQKKMLRMKDEPIMCMKTKDRTTKCPAEKTPFPRF